MDSPALARLSKYSNARLFDVKAKKLRENRAKKRMEQRENGFFPSESGWDYDSSDEDEDGKRKKSSKKRIFRPALEPSKATTTPLVTHFFASVFGGEMDIMKNSSMKSCGKCEPCRLPDCSDCENCRKMKKFNGSIEDHDVVGHGGSLFLIFRLIYNLVGTQTDPTGILAVLDHQ